MDQIKITKKDDYINVYVPIISQGKFRCKFRNGFQEYGVGLAPKSTIIPNNAYIEWQIGYDKLVKDSKKKTRLKSIKFIGANGKEKNPYELSEIFYCLCENKVILKKEINELIDTIENIKGFLQEIYSIEVSKENTIVINDEDFYKSTITLPTFNKINPNSNITIQVSIEKQQYATGVQPMLYVNIPISDFENADKLIGNTSKNEKYGILRIDKERKNLIKDIFVCFGMCSKSHQHDILEILKSIRDSLRG